MKTLIPYQLRKIPTVLLVRLNPYKFVIFLDLYTTCLCGKVHTDSHRVFIPLYCFPFKETSQQQYRRNLNRLAVMVQLTHLFLKRSLQQAAKENRITRNGALRIGIQLAKMLQKMTMLLHSESIRIILT